MTASMMTTPRFNKNQLVYFIGGVGKILGYRPDSDTWVYTVEMEMQPEPPMGRVGAETRLLLSETDIQGVMN
jgi:hypothetical protein